MESVLNSKAVEYQHGLKKASKSGAFWIKGHVTSNVYGNYSKFKKKKKNSKLETLVAPSISEKSYSLCRILPFGKEGFVNRGVASQSPLQMFSLPVYLVPVISEGGDSSENCDCVLCTSHPAFLLLKMWEKAIKLSKELAETYESKVFDYEGLGSLLVSLGQWGC